MKKLWPFLFFGNYFYGLCAVALSIEAGLQQQYGINDYSFYVLLFLCTILYYTKAYTKSQYIVTNQNLRAIWYQQHHKSIKITQIIFIVLLLLMVLNLFFQNIKNLLELHLHEIILLFIFPLVGWLYYGLENKPNTKLQLRRIGWLKPFIIGFCWAGVVTVYPIIYFQMCRGQHFEPNFISLLLFTKNFMFVSVLSIMFDIKDYASDFNQELKTFVVKYGLRKTIFFIIVPLTLLGLISFLTYAFSQHFSFGKIALNLIPFVLILIVANSLQKRQSIFYYLVVIDGLMLLKGICGSLAMLLF